jgi:RNA polymerase sigma-70 factor (ECF subfamily)
MGMRLQILQKLWDDHSRVIYGYLLKLSRDPDFAADLLQDLFCRLGQNDELLARMGEQPRGFLLRLAYNSMVDKVRRDEARARVFAKMGLDGTEPQVDAADPDMGELEKALKAALVRLPEEQRVVVAARYLGRQTFEEIAASQGISINTAASRFRYGVDKMREELRELYDSLNGRESGERSKRMNDRNRDGDERDELADDPLIRPLEARRVPSASVLPWMELLQDLDTGVAEHGNEVSTAAVAGGLDHGVESGEDMVFLDPGEWGGTWEEAEPPVSFEEIARQVLQEADGEEIRDPAGFLGWLISQNTVAGDGSPGSGGVQVDGAVVVQGAHQGPNETAVLGLVGGGLVTSGADPSMVPSSGRVGLMSAGTEMGAMSSNLGSLQMSAGSGAGIGGEMAEREVLRIQGGALELWLGTGGVVTGPMVVDSSAGVVDVDLTQFFRLSPEDPASAEMESAGVDSLDAEVAGAEAENRMAGEAVYLTGVSGSTGVGTVPGTGQPVYPAEQDGEVLNSNVRDGLPELEVGGVVVVDVEAVRGEDAFSRVTEIQLVDNVHSLGSSPVLAADLPQVEPATVWGPVGTVAVPVATPMVDLAETVAEKPVEMQHPVEAADWIQPSAEVLGQLSPAEEEGVVPGLFAGPLGEVETGLKAGTGWTTIGVAGATTVLGATGRQEKKEAE